MIDFLVADDEPQKINDVKNLLSTKIDANIFESVCFDSTIEIIFNGEIDLIILDMSLPTFSGSKSGSGRMRALGGKDILEIMDYEDINIPVIIFTQFDVFGRAKDIISIQDVDNELKKSFPEFYIGSVMYDSRSGDWKPKLCELLSLAGFL